MVATVASSAWEVSSAACEVTTAGIPVTTPSELVSVRYLVAGLEYATLVADVVVDAAKAPTAKAETRKLVACILIVVCERDL